MTALDRYDEWERGLLEQELDDDAAMAPVRFEDRYDAGTLAAIEGRRREPKAVQARRAGWSATAVLAGSAVLGAARGLGGGEDPEADDDIAGEFERHPAAPRVEAVTVILVPGDPAASVAIVRRWLL